jgi:hypothetical protein
LTDFLALSLPLSPCETAFSFMSRIAARNGISAQSFGNDMGIPFSAIIDGNPDAIGSLATLTHASCEDLLAWSPQNRGKRQHSFRGEIFHAHGIKATVIRRCPVCLREDAAASDRPPEQSMAIRGHWLPRHVTLCLKHHKQLIPLWKVTSKIERYDSAVNFGDKATDLLGSGLIEFQSQNKMVAAKATADRNTFGDLS